MCIVIAIATNINTNFIQSIGMKKNIEVSIVVHKTEIDITLTLQGIPFPC